MKLKSLNYAQHEGLPKQWRLTGLLLGDVNLLVGRNASGKSRSLNIINGFAKLLSRVTKIFYASGHYEATFEDEGKPLEYTLRYEDSKVNQETFIVDGTPRLTRAQGGIGKIWSEQNQSWMDFQAPEDQLAAVARQDAIQHPYFLPLLQWAQSLYHYPFGSPLGQHRFAVLVNGPNVAFDPKDPGNVVAIFRRGIKDFGEAFKKSIMQDMATIGYPLNDIDAQAPSSVTISGPFPGPIVGLCVQETALPGPTDQTDMSQGMFRCLSVIIQITYAQMSSPPGSVLIDDIGEGLDFERSCHLIRLLIDKATASDVQLMMATNDRFVMNVVPLESWSILQRSGGDSAVFNYANSKAKFDDFKFTGMNNFDFFATDFLSGGEEP